MMMMMILMMMTIMVCAAVHLRTTTLVVMDSRCRGGIVNTRFGCSRELLARHNSSTALWRFRASTSNSPSGRSRPLPNTQTHRIYQTYAQQDIRVCGDDHF